MQAPSLDVMTWLRTFRHRILNLLLTSVVLLGSLGLAVLFNHFITHHTFRFSFLLAYYLGSYTLSWILLLARRMSDRWRAIGFLSLLYIFTVFTFMTGWLGGGGRTFLLAFIVLAAILIGPVAGILAAVISLITYSVFGLAFYRGWLVYALAPQYNDPLIIVTEGIGFTMAVGMISIALWFFKAGLDAANEAIAEAQQARAELAERAEELNAANRELESFSYSVSHDLRAPLRAINAYTSILVADFSSGFSTEVRGMLEKIIISGQRMNQLIDDLLTFSRLGRKPLEKTDVDMTTLVRIVIESLVAETAHRQIEWILAELPPAHADPTLLQQVYANLIGNAVKYSSKCALARIEVGSFKQDEKNVYLVRDNGAGFDMQYANQLFGVFQRLHASDEFEGSGIGLATVQRIIHRHGGRIWAEAAVDQGATFFFTLE